MKRILFNLLLAIIFCITIYFAFFYALTHVPPGFYVDEAATGYNAYSILLTGKDEYGKRLPILFKLFGSFSPPIYIYLSIIPMKIWGLSIWSTRFISALSGALSAFVIVFFLRELVAKRKKEIVVFTLLWIISPWVVFFSRIGYEIFLGSVLFSIGALLLYLGIEKKKLIPVSWVFLALSTYGAHTERFLVPLFVAVFFALFRKDLQLKSRENMIGIALFMLLQIPHISILFTSAFLVKGGLFYSEAVDGPVSLMYEFFSRYLTYFSPKSLFFVGDPMPQRAMPALSVFYPWMLAPYLVGIYKLLLKPTVKANRFIILLLVLTPIPAALTRDPFTTQRALPVFLPIFLVICMGMSEIVNRVKSRFIWPFIVLMLLYSALLLWRSYFILLPAERGDEWNTAYSQLIIKLQEYEGESILIDQTRLKPLYAHYLFFNKYPPANLHNNINPNEISTYYSNPDFESGRIIDNVEFGAIKWEEDICVDQIIVGDSLLFSESNIKEHKLTPLFSIVNVKGELAFMGVRTNPKSKCSI